MGEAIMMRASIGNLLCLIQSGFAPGYYRLDCGQQARGFSCQWDDRMDFDKLSKGLFYTVGLAAVCILLLLFGMYAGYRQNSLFQFVQRPVVALVHGAAGLRELNLVRPGDFIQPARGEGAGVTVNELQDQGGYVLMSGFFGNDNGIRLVRRDGTLVRAWTLQYSQIFTDTGFLPLPPATDWNVDTDGVLAMPDGSVVVDFEFSGLARIGRCGEVMWTVPLQTHHSVERAEAGGFWVPGRRVVTDPDATQFPPFFPPFSEPSILLISDDGEVLREISVPRLFYASGLEAVLSSKAIFYKPGLGYPKNPPEIVHLNKIAELSSDLADDFQLFEAGDLMLSMRDLNLVAVIDPDSERIKWWSIGPWLRQHDPEFRQGGTIVVFNNNIYSETAFAGIGDKSSPRARLAVPRVSNIMEMDPLTRRVKLLFGGAIGQEMLSIIRGKVDLTAGGGLLVTEFEAGRVFETDSRGNITWEYVNRYDEDEVAEITEARYYPEDYFQVRDWSCPETQG